MTELQGYQKKYLRGLAHSLQAVVMVGQKGFSSAVVTSTEEALTAHELIKLKFVDFKEKEQKVEIASKLADTTGSALAGIIGHTAILYRPHPDPDRRRIVLP
jgi:RNA-binding protein